MKTSDYSTSKNPADKIPFREFVKYIRIKSHESARFVDFDFAIGDPTLFVELIMPKDAFDEFCLTNNTVLMTLEQTLAVDAEMKKWRYGEETLMAHNHR